MTKQRLALYGSLIIAALAACQTAQAQCNDATIARAYQAVFQRQPTAQECNPNLYGGGTYGSDMQKLQTWVMASKVCRDPWIAEVYATELKRQINNHNPTMPDPNDPSSARDQCNPYYYRRTSWNGWNDLVAMLRDYYGMGPAPVAPAPTQPPAPAPPSGPAVSLNGVTYRVNPAKLLNINGNLLDINGGTIQAAGGGNYIDKSAVLRNAGGAAIVAAGGGNIVAAGGGNIVAAGGGNIVAAGGGNFSLSIARDRALPNPNALLDGSGYILDTWGVRILPAGTGNRFLNSVLVNAQGAPIISHDGGTFVVSGNELKSVTNSAAIAQVLSGRLTVAQVVGTGGSSLTLGTLNPGQVLNPGQIPVNPNILTNSGANVTRTIQSVGSTQPFTLKITGPAAIVKNQPATVTWTFSGTPAATLLQCGVSVLMTTGGGARYQLALKVPLSAMQAALKPANWPFAANMPATLVLADGCSNQTLTPAGFSTTIRVQ